MGNLNFKIFIDADKLITVLDKEEENTIKALKKAHSTVGSQAVKMLKRGLNWRAGKDSSDPNYKNSPKGALPYKHSGRLQKSIGLKVLASGRKVISEVGSGANKNPIEYAGYLQGENNDGIRPFLDYIDGVYNPQTIMAEFDAIFTPLEGAK